MYTLDTNAIIYYLKKDSSAVAVFEKIFSRNIPVYISTITELELFSYPAIGQEEAGLIDIALKTVSIIPLDSRIARLAGSLRRLYRLKISDAAIAATTLSTGSTLVTRNTKDFRKIPNIRLESL